MPDPPRWLHGGVGFNLRLSERTKKITAIKTSVCNAEMRNWVFVRVETDLPGLYGWGKATLEWKTRSVVGAVQDLEPLLIGRDPRDIEQNRCSFPTRTSPHHRNSRIMSAA